MSRSQRALTSCCAIVLTLPIAAPALAQTETSPKANSNSVKLDLLAESVNRQILFDKDALTLELNVQEMIVGRVAIDIVKPAGGTLQLELASENSIELTPPNEDTGLGGELFCPVEVIGSKDVAKRVDQEIAALLAAGIKRGLKEARSRPEAAAEEYLRKRNVPLPDSKEELHSAFALEWAKENDAQPVLDAIRPLIEKHPKWFSRDEKAHLLAAKGREGCNLFHALRADDLYDEHLRNCGLALQTEGGTARKRLEPRFQAVFVAMSGALSGNAASKGRVGKAAPESLSQGDAKKLRQALTADMKCRFTFVADPEDANSLWCNAQRLVSPGTGPSLRIEGRLEPDSHDRVDWWHIDRWKPGQTTLDLSKLSAGRWEQYPLEGALLLRVAATDEEPVDYHFELRPAGKPAGKATVVLHETPTPSAAKFPF